jgi:serine/threonine protein kinase
MEVLRPDTRIGPNGRFIIRDLLGSGGMGQVYRAVDSLMMREVALKTLHRKLVADDPKYSDRFLNEARAAAGIKHPNVVEIYDTGVHDDQPYIIMEYLKGKSLDALLRQGPLPVQRAIDIMLSVCSAVYYCHRHKVYHRDLKPDNVFIVDTDQDHDLDHIVILDFGVAKMARLPELTRAGGVIGTPSFFAPESLSSPSIDPRTADQYALGVLLYYTLTRRLPFRAESDLLLWQAIRSGVYKKASEQRPEITPGLDAVIQRAMHLNPTARFENVHILGRALLEHASPAGRRHWSTQFTAIPRPIRAPAPSMAILATKNLDASRTQLDLDPNTRQVDEGSLNLLADASARTVPAEERPPDHATLDTLQTSRTKGIPMPVERSSSSSKYRGIPVAGDTAGPSLIIDVDDPVPAATSLDLVPPSPVPDLSAAPVDADQPPPEPPTANTWINPRSIAAIATFVGVAAVAGVIFAARRSTPPARPLPPASILSTAPPRVQPSPATTPVAPSTPAAPPPFSVAAPSEPLPPTGPAVPEQPPAEVIQPTTNNMTPTVKPPKPTLRPHRVRTPRSDSHGLPLLE